MHVQESFANEWLKVLIAFVSWHRGSLLPMLFDSQSKGGRPGMPASVASELSSSYVYCSTLKDKSSEHEHP